MPRPTTTFEVTCKAVQGRMLLRPSGQLNDLLLGIIGRALALYPVMLHLFVTASNHIHLIITVSDFQLLSDFMCYFNSNLAREAGRLTNWKEKFWGRRFTAIPIDGELDFVRRVRYLLSHGCKENLVRHPAHWPGTHCVQALTEGKTLSGTWIDRTAHYEAGRQGEERSLAEFAIRYEVPLSPLPILEHLNETERQEWYRRMVQDIADETSVRIRKEGRGVLGARKVLRQKPHERPRKVKRSPAPLCHCSDPERFKEIRDAYRWFRDAYRMASRRLRQGDLTAPFPDNCFRPAPAFYRLEVEAAPG
jgi:REP element-mobilizing transposase RayT